MDHARGRVVVDDGMSFTHPFPPTHIEFIPDPCNSRPDLLATSGDKLRIWNVSGQGTTLDKVLSSNQGSEKAQAVTCFNWNEFEINRMVSGCTDCTNTVWDVETGVVETQMMAHDGEVYDITWGGMDIFASASADGSVRVFDMRDKEHSTIVYEQPRRGQGFLKLSWNKQDPRYMALLGSDSRIVTLTDIRRPNMPVAELDKHAGNVTSICWAPHSMSYLCSAGEDRQALIWDLGMLTRANASDNTKLEACDPILAYDCGAMINQLKWSTLNPKWVSICYQNKAQILRV